MLMASPFLGQLVMQKTLTVAPEETVTLPPVEVKKAAIGALRIDVQANLSNNRWLTFEIQILDSQGNLLASAIKQAWRESGTWQEEGESGTWQEADSRGGLDVRPGQSEPLTIAIQVLEYTSPSGQEVDEGVPFTVTVRTGVVDTRYLWTGFLGTSVLAVFSLLAVQVAGKKVIDKAMSDSEVGDRLVLGGRDQLLRLTVKIESDETSPPTLDVNLSIKNSQGDQVYHRAHPVKLSYKKENNKIESATGNLTLFFGLESRKSYGFFVEVTPDGPVDKTRLIVREGAKTLGGAEIIHIP